MKPFSALVRWQMFGALWLGLLPTGTATAPTTAVTGLLKTNN